MLLAEKMETLTAGEYTLTGKKSSVLERKSILFVKLTDSAQRALANYLRSLNSREVPLIEFGDDEGRLLIPSAAESGDTDPFVAFKFDVCSNDTMQGKQGRFECAQHRRGSRQLLKYGQLTQRLRIHAKEDVYETTKNRMAAIDQQQRQNCTVQLDWNSTTKGSGPNRKLKLQPKSFLMAANSRCGGDNDHSAAKLTSNMIRSKSRPVNNAPPKKINPASTGLIRKPLKERIVHLLALKPYRRPELETVLRRDGVRDCDRSHIVDTLVSVSTFRDNAYHLSKHAWNDVQEDWPFYTEAERQQCKKNKLQNLTSPSSSSDSGVSVTSNQSPNNNQHVGGGPTNQSSPPQSYKRPGYFNGVDGFQTKRQRISHFVKQEPPSRSQGQPGFEKPKYMKDYVTITDTEQRSRYKADFSKIFVEYETVHKEVDRVRNLFAQLGEKLKEHKKGSRDYAKVEHDILSKYYTLKSNRNFQDAKRRYEYLHEKLSHIKNLVNEYDDKVRKQM